jgi:hypothetical protein
MLLLNVFRFSLKEEKLLCSVATDPEELPCCISFNAPLKMAAISGASQVLLYLSRSALFAQSTLVGRCRHLGCRE